MNDVASTPVDSSTSAREHDPADAVRGHAAELSALAQTLGLNEMAQSITAETERRLARETARVVVLGEIKHGKSSLINALVGAPILPVGVTPTTGRSVTIRAGEPTGAWLVDGDDRQLLDAERFKALVIGKDSGPGRLEVTVDTSRLPPGIELVDTPGVNDMQLFRAEASRHELPRADAVVVVLDATQLLSRSEAGFIRDVLVAVGGLGSRGASLFLVINRIDLVQPDDRAALQSHLLGQLDAVLGEDRRQDALRVFQISARQALAEEVDATSSSSIESLRSALREYAHDRAVRLPNRARGAIARQLTLVSHHAAVLSRALDLDQETIATEIQQVKAGLIEQQRDTERLRQRLRDERKQLVHGSRKRIEEFRNELQSNALTHVRYASLRTLSTNFPGSIHDAFLAFAEDESGRLRTSLDDLTRRALHTHSELVRRHLAQAMLRLGLRGPTVYVQPPSLALEASAVAVGVVGTAVMYFGNLMAGMAMTVAGPLATVVIREQTLRRARDQAREALPQALGQAAEALVETIAGAVDDHIGALEDQLSIADAELGGQLVAVLERARQSLHTEDGDLEAVTQRRSEAKSAIAATERRLRALADEVARSQR